MDRLFFIYMPDCATCAAVKPIVRKFRDEHPDVKVVPVDITGVDWKAEKWMPQVTPTLIKLDRNKRWQKFDGYPAADGGRVVNPEDVATWLSANF